MIKKWFWLSFILILTAELIARFVFGLGTPPLYIEDKEYEYIYAPNQDVKRFGNKIITNEYSMRSLPLSNSDGLRIIKIGDSVINGGSKTDHDSLASSILEKSLSGAYKKNIRVLNIGANSWGPDNGFAYIKKFGHFGAGLIIMVFSSHDLYDHMHFQKVVGMHPAWPAKKPFLAIQDAVVNYVIPFIRKKLDKNYNEYAYLINASKTKGYNSGWLNMAHYCRTNNLQLLVYIHASKKEILSKRYDKNGNDLLDFLGKNNIKVIKGLDQNFTENDYRDFIHLNNSGQKKLAETLEPFTRDYIRAKDMAH